MYTGLIKHSQTNGLETEIVEEKMFIFSAETVSREIPLQSFYFIFFNCFFAQILRKAMLVAQLTPGVKDRSNMSKKKPIMCAQTMIDDRANVNKRFAIHAKC